MPNDPTYAFFGNIVEKRRDEAGNLLVYGKAAGDDLDLDKQVLDATWLSTALPEWFDTGANVRLQHDMHRPVGKGTEHEVKDDGHWVMSKVVDAEAQKLVDEGVLMGYSVGIKNPQIRKDDRAPNGRIVGGQIIEVSLVDRPANPTCSLTLAKAAGKKAEVTLPPGVKPEADKGLVRTEEIKVSTSAGHTHSHVHEDGAHSHAHPHTPLDGHYDHGDGVPHEHAHDPKDPQRVEEAGSEPNVTSHTGEELSEPERNKAVQAAAEALVAPTFDAGPQAPDELHKATMAKMEATQAPPVSSGAPVSMTIEDIQALISKGVAEALEKATKVDPAKPHAFVDDNGDGKCDACGEKRDDAMHHRSFGNDKAAEPDAVKDVPADPKLERCITDLYSSDDMKAKYPKDEDRKSHAIAICRAALDKVAGTKTAEPEVVKKDYSAAKRVELAKKGQAIPVRDSDGNIVGGRYPVADGGDLKDAIQSIGRAKGDVSEVKDFIKRRAKALGMTDQIPDSWKVADYDVAKALLKGMDLLTKQEGGEGPDDGQVDQRPAYAAACQGLATLITQEAAELAAGSDEYWSLYCLLQALQGLRAFKKGEVAEGEMDGDDTNGGNPMWMEAVPDLVKAIGDLPGAVASEVAKALRPADIRAEKGPSQAEPDPVPVTPAFDPAKEFATTLREELAKAMKPLEGIEALSGRMAKVEETVERIAKSPVPSGPRRTGLPNGTPPRSTADAHREKAAYLTDQASRTSNSAMAEGYRSLAADELAKAAALDATN